MVWFRLARQRGCDQTVRLAFRMQIFSINQPPYGQMITPEPAGACSCQSLFSADGLGSLLLRHTNSCDIFRIHGPSSDEQQQLSSLAETKPHVCFWCVDTLIVIALESIQTVRSTEVLQYSCTYPRKSKERF